MRNPVYTLNGGRDLTLATLSPPSQRLSSPLLRIQVKIATLRVICDSFRFRGLAQGLDE